MTLDAYYIKINDRIVSSGAIQGQQAPAGGRARRNRRCAGATPLINGLTLLSWCSTPLRPSGKSLDPTVLQWGSLSIQTFTNGIDTETIGLEFSPATRCDLPFGTLDLSLGANYNSSTKVTDSAPWPRCGPCWPRTRSSVPARCSRPTSARCSRPAGSASTSAPTSTPTPSSWCSRMRSRSRRGRSTGAYTKPRSAAAAIVDLEVAYDFTEFFRPAVGANNLFDKKPEIPELVADYNEASLAAGWLAGRSPYINNSGTINAPFTFGPYGHATAAITTPALPSTSDPLEAGGTSPPPAALPHRKTCKGPPDAQQRLLLAALHRSALCAPAGGALAQEARERTVSSPTAMISSSISVPPGSRILFISGTHPSPLDPADPRTSAIPPADPVGPEQDQGAARSAGDGHGRRGQDDRVPRRRAGERRADGFGGDERGVPHSSSGTAERPDRPTRSTIQVAASRPSDDVRRDRGGDRRQGSLIKRSASLSLARRGYEGLAACCPSRSWRGRCGAKLRPLAARAPPLSKLSANPLRGRSTAILSPPKEGRGRRRPMVSVCSACSHREGAERRHAL